MALALDGIAGIRSACGFRRLLTAWAGACFQCNDGSTDADIGFSGNDVDLAAMVAHVGADTGTCKTFYDQSGGSRDLTRVTAATVRASSANTTVGGKLACTVVGKSLTNTGSVVTDFLANNAGTVLCGFEIVANTTNEAAIFGNTALWKDAGSDLGVHIKNTDVGVQEVNSYNFDTNSDVAPSNQTTAVPLAVAWRHGGGNLGLNVNRSAWVTVASGNTDAGAASDLEIGFSTGSMKLTEIVFFNVALTDQQVDDWQREYMIWTGLISLGGGVRRRKPYFLYRRFP